LSLDIIYILKIDVYFLNHYYLKKDNNTIYTTIHMRISSSLFLYTSLLFSVCAIQIPEYSLNEHKQYIEQPTYEKEYFSHSDNHCIAYHYAIKYDGHGSIYIAGTERDLTIHTHKEQCGNVSQGWKKVVAFDNRYVRYIIIKTFGYLNGIKCGGYLTMDTSIPKIHIFEKCHWGNDLDDKNTVHTPLITMKVIATKYGYELNTNQRVRLRIHDLSNSSSISNEKVDNLKSNLYIRKPHYLNSTHAASDNDMESMSSKSMSHNVEKGHTSHHTSSSAYASYKVEHSSATTSSPKVEHSSATTSSPKVEHSSTTLSASPKVKTKPGTTSSHKVETKPATTSSPKVEHSSTTLSASPNVETKPATTSSPKMETKPGTTSSHKVEHSSTTLSASPKVETKPGTTSSPKVEHSSTTLSASPKVETKPGTTSSPKVETKPGTTSSHKVDTKPGTTSSPKVETKPGTTSSHKVDTKPGTTSSHKVETKPGTTSSPKVEHSSTTLSASPKVETKPGTTSSPKVEHSSTTLSASPKVETTSSPKVDTKLGTTSSPKVETKPGTSSSSLEVAPATTSASVAVSPKVAPATTSVSVLVSTSPKVEHTTTVEPLQTTIPQESSPPIIAETTMEFIKTFAGQWYLTAETMEIANNPRPCRTITIFENENKLFFKTAINQGNQTFLVFDTLITEYNNISKTFVMNGLKNTYNLFHINNINYLYINDSKYEYLYCNDYNCNSEYTMTPALKAVITENKYNIIITDMSCYTD
jgi:hypothetical protein